MPNDKFSTTGPDNSTNHESKDNQPVAPLSASSRPLEQKPADIILPTLDADLNIDVDPNKRSTVATVLEKYNPNAPEENQQPAVAAALTALESHRVASRIDKKSLAANDDLDKCNDALRRGNCPTENYPSNVGYYGFDVQHGEEVSTYTQSGMGRLMLGLEDWFYKKRDGGALLGKSIRRKISGKGFGEKILDRAKELGQGERFRLDEDGNLTEKNDDMRSGMLLDDLLRFGKRTEPEYQFLRDHAGEIDRALELTAQMIAQTHRTSGKGIGEVLCNDIVLKVEDGKITGARLSAPDVMYEKGVDELEQQATDLIDLCFSAGSAGFQIGDEKLAESHINAILDNYNNDFVKIAARAMVETRPYYGYITNRPRLGFDRVRSPREAFEQVREIVKTALSNPPRLPQ